MHLKKPFWSDSTKSDSELESPVTDLINSLDNQRLYREITLALRTGLNDARAEFSFLRVRGLRSILEFLQSVTESDTSINLFCHTQSIPDLRVVPVLFQHSLKDSEEHTVSNLDHIFSVDPVKIISPSTDAEVALALRVLEGCCLLHGESNSLAHQHNAIPVLMNILSTRGVLEQGACIDALISLMLDSSANQVDFQKCNGIEEVVLLIRDKQVDENLRLKCAEFLILLIGYLNGRDRSPMARIHEDLMQFLGDEPASLIWTASHGLTANQGLTALSFQAQGVLESIDLY